MFKIMLVKLKWQHEDDPDIAVQEVSLLELLETPEVQAELKMLGWADIKKLTDKNLRIMLNKKFFMLRDGQRVAKCLDDLTSLETADIHTLASGTLLVQQVSHESVLTPEQHKCYLAAKRLIEKQKGKEVQSRAQRAEKKKAKEIAKAKKVLEAHGVKVDEAKP